MLMITLKDVLYLFCIRLYFIACFNSIFCIKIKNFKNRKFLYYIQHELIYFPQSETNKVFY